MRGLDRLFKPKSVVIVGASSKRGRVGYELLKNLVEHGYVGEIYGLNPRGGEAFNIRFYRDIDDLPDNIDLALIAISSSSAIETLEKLAAKGLGSAVIYASGFAEIGNKELQNRLENLIKRYGVRIVGPNCAGIVNNIDSLYASFVPKVGDGSLAMASQSGAFSAIVTNYLALKGMGLASLVTLGNKVDVDETDFIMYFSRYDMVKSYMLYIEGLKSYMGRRLAQIVKEVGKPVVILKGGSTEGVEETLYSHTASLAGDFRVIKSILEAAGAYFVYDYIELADVSEATSYLDPPNGGKIAIVTNGGGPGVIAVDYIHKLGHKLSRTPSDILKKLDHLKPYMARANPIDLTADGDEDMYYHTLKSLMDRNWPDIIYVIHVPPSFIDPYKVAKAVGDAYIDGGSSKPLIPLFMGVDISRISKTLHEYSLPAPTTHRSASMVIDYLIRLGMVKYRSISE
ncbi:TPA: hypothetical protein EYP83_02410 [Candidatus Geothermarchaeota archaeon]|nr:hypothetical protein [Candidatus Geothermarchaeota archaeon]